MAERSRLTQVIGMARKARKEERIDQRREEKVSVGRVGMEVRIFRGETRKKFRGIGSRTWEEGFGG